MIELHYITSFHIGYNSTNLIVNLQIKWDNVVMYLVHPVWHRHSNGWWIDRSGLFSTFFILHLPLWYFKCSFRLASYPLSNTSIFFNLLWFQKCAQWLSSFISVYVLTSPTLFTLIKFSSYHHYIKFLLYFPSGHFWLNSGLAYNLLTLWWHGSDTSPGDTVFQIFNLNLFLV